MCCAQERLRTGAGLGMRVVVADGLLLPDAPSAVGQNGAGGRAATEPGSGSAGQASAGQGSSGLGSAGSEAQAPPAAETEAQRKERLHREAEHDVKVQETQRIAVVVPNFNTVMSGRAVPLSKGQKTELAVHATFDPFNLVGAFFLAGASEVTDSDRGFGWGPEGYFKRVGANLADVFDGTMLAGAVYPILLRQDPRFFRQVTGTKKARVRHALLAAVICRGDNGRTQPNFSNVLGNFSAGLISNLYYPKSETGVSLALVNSSVVTLEGAAGNIGLEFSPDFARWWKERKMRVQTP